MPLARPLIRKCFTPTATYSAPESAENPFNRDYPTLLKVFPDALRWNPSDENLHSAETFVQKDLTRQEEQPNLIPLVKSSHCLICVGGVLLYWAVLKANRVGRFVRAIFLSHRRLSILFISRLKGILLFLLGSWPSELAFPGNQSCLRPTLLSDIPSRHKHSIQ